MRADMKDVIVNTGRHGMWDKKGEVKALQNYRRNDYENAPTHESMSRHRISGGGRSLGDRTGPLVNYLRSQLGRRWDEVYSEIREVNDKRELRGFHLLTHLMDYVQINECPGRVWGRYFHVDSRGILVETPRIDWRRRHRERLVKSPVEKLKLDDHSWYELIKGIWFRFESHKVVRNIPEYHGVCANGESYIAPPRTVVEDIVLKRQVGKKELRVVRERVRTRNGVIYKEKQN